MSPDLRGLCDIRLVELQDGGGRGQRLLFLRNAVGVEVEISLDRGFDCSALRWRGVSLGWHSPAGGGVPVADREAEAGLAPLRGFDGFQVTCGLDHFGLPDEVDAAHFLYPPRRTLHRPLHGRIMGCSSTLRGYGIEKDADVPYLWCEAEVRQAALFAEVLVLRRRFEVPLFEPTVRLSDVVRNAGWRPTQHEVLYHFNLGYPLLGRATRLTGDFAPECLAEFAASPPIADADALEIFELVGLSNPSGSRARVGLFNPDLDGGTALDILFDRHQLPGFGLWRAYQAGVFAVGLEPFFRSDQGTMLGSGEERRYDIEVALSAPR